VKSTGPSLLPRACILLAAFSISMTTGCSRNTLSARGAPGEDGGGTGPATEGGAMTAISDGSPAGDALVPNSLPDASGPSDAALFELDASVDRLGPDFPPHRGGFDADHDLRPVRDVEPLPPGDAAPGAQFCSAPTPPGGGACVITGCRGPGCTPAACGQPGLVSCPQGATCEFQGGAQCEARCGNGGICNTVLDQGGKATCKEAESCGVVCSENCALSCVDNARCRLNAAKGATVGCGDHSQCSINCSGDCRIECGSSMCDIAAPAGAKVTCLEGSSCLVNCGATEVCEVRCDADSICKCNGAGCKILGPP
jgi:hypothetical protein